MRGGKLIGSQWGLRLTGEGIFAEQNRRMCDGVRHKAGLTNDQPPLSTTFRRPGGIQLTLL